MSNFEQNDHSDSYTFNEDGTYYGNNAVVRTENKAEKPRKGKATGKIIALALCCSLVGGTMGAGGYALATGGSSADTHTVISEGNRDTATIDVSAVSTGTEMSPSEVYAANVNSTVGIKTSITTNYWGYTTTSAAAGSGFILTADGYILTNFHVVENSSSVTVTTYDGTSYTASVIGYDESNDIAVLKVDASNLTPVILGDSSKMNVGDFVEAIGNPLGELTFSMTYGAVSALDREVTMSSGITMNLIQTDCAINSGNSGGALFNMYGEVIGITNAKYSGSSSSSASIDNIGFAIPINSVRDIVYSIIEKGYIAKPYIGVTVADVSTESQAYGLPTGAAIKSVTDASPAQKAGLMANDIITAVNGNTISTSKELTNLIKQSQTGDELTLSVYRQGQTLEISITVGEQTQSAIAQTDTTEDSRQSASDGSQSEMPWFYKYFQ